MQALLFIMAGAFGFAIGFMFGAALVNHVRANGRDDEPAYEDGEDSHG